MLTELEADLLADAWAAAGGTDLRPADLDACGPSGHLPSRFAVEAAAVASVGAALLAAVALHRLRGGSAPAVTLDREHVAAALVSERHFRQRGRAPAPFFAALSRFWRTADGWVRTHGNYPWHREALLRALGTPDDPDAIAPVMARLPSAGVEERVFASGGVAAAVRTVEDWRDHPQGRAVTGEPLIGHQVVGEAPGRRRPAGGSPAAGVRVLDLTRVIAGPVCTRFVGALGADVLRVDPPGHPDMSRGVAADTLLGKRSAALDLAAPGGDGRDALALVHALADDADLVVSGYRPGALDRFGLAPGELAERHPGLVVVVLDAWGHRGPWAGRRGFDSVVQAPTGLALGETRREGEPGALPCQFLDHGTGYLAAAAALDGLRRQAEHGGTVVRRLSLARTAGWLVAAPAPANRPPTGDTAAGADAPWLVELPAAGGPVTAVAPPGSLDDRPLRWPAPATGYGTDPPAWSPALGRTLPGSHGG